MESSELNVDATLKRITSAALGYSNGSRTEAAKLMGVSIRTLRNWIHKYELVDFHPAAYGKPSHAAKK